jgi:hypothetical protein
MASQKALPGSCSRRNAAKTAALWRSFEPRGPSHTTSPLADSFRRKAAIVAMVLAVVVLIVDGVFVVVLGYAVVHGERWSVTCVGPPCLGATAVLFVMLWRTAERLSIPLERLDLQAETIRALTGQRHRLPPKAAQRSKTAKPRKD